MEADINSAKSKGYNCLLRFLQYSLLLFVCNRVLVTNQQSCSEFGHTYTNLLGLISLVLLAFNLLALCYVTCRARFARTEFFIALSINIVVVLVVIGLSLTTMMRAPTECMQVILLQKWAVFTSVVVLLITLLVLSCGLFWVQRYTNSPGNIAWAYMFLTITWTSLPHVKLFLLGIGIAYLCISLFTFLVNASSLCGGTTTTSKRCIKCWWIFVIVLMAVFEIIALIGYLGGNLGSSFYEIGANRLLQMFLVGNFIDLLFWLWGLMALRYENGDLIRDELIDRNQAVDPASYTPAPNPYLQGMPFEQEVQPRRNVTMMGTILH
jgi:hypothetical protein